MHLTFYFLLSFLVCSLLLIFTMHPLDTVSYVFSLKILLWLFLFSLPACMIPHWTFGDIYSIFPAFRKVSLSLSRWLNEPHLEAPEGVEAKAFGETRMAAPRPFCCSIPP